ncbi:MAG: hypothetical protein RLN90_10365 [Balneolaceae bacterium]
MKKLIAPLFLMCSISLSAQDDDPNLEFKEMGVNDKYINRLCEYAAGNGTRK